jgi:CheY-like chemotaxis protein
MERRAHSRQRRTLVTASSLQVLIVEDNVGLQNMLCEMVVGLGHRARGVGSAEEALDLLDDLRFDVLLADVTLPGMSGIALATIAIEKNPAIRIVFSTGHGYLLSERLDFDFALLHKPYFLHQLMQAIGPPPAKSLDAPSGQ